jgi:uncharacterized protein YhjY with autotransporter beta-barrel domain
VLIKIRSENSSKEYSNDIIKELTKRCEDRGYKFVYIGANQDSFAVSSGMGIVKGFSFNYVADSYGVATAYTSMSTQCSSYINDLKTNTKTYNDQSGTYNDKRGTYRIHGKNFIAD